MNGDIEVAEAMHRRIYHYDTTGSNFACHDWKPSGPSERFCWNCGHKRDEHNFDERKITHWRE